MYDELSIHFKTVVQKYSETFVRYNIFQCYTRTPPVVDIVVRETLQQRVLDRGHYLKSSLWLIRPRTQVAQVSTQTSGESQFHTSPVSPMSHLRLTCKYYALTYKFSVSPVNPTSYLQVLCLTCNYHRSRWECHTWRPGRWRWGGRWRRSLVTTGSRGQVVWAVPACLAPASDSPTVLSRLYGNRSVDIHRNICRHFKCK